MHNRAHLGKIWLRVVSAQKGVAIIMANEAPVSISALTVKRDSDNLKMEVRDFYRN